MRRPEFVMRLKTRRKIDTREKRLVSLHHSAILRFIRPANVNSLKPICLYDFNGILLTKNHNHAGTTFPLTYALFETIFRRFFFSRNVHYIPANRNLYSTETFELREVYNEVLHSHSCDSSGTERNIERRRSMIAISSYSTCRFSQLLLLLSFKHILFNISLARFRLSAVLLP